MESRTLVLKTGFYQLGVDLRFYRRPEHPLGCHATEVEVEGKGLVALILGYSAFPGDHPAQVVAFRHRSEVDGFQIIWRNNPGNSIKKLIKALIRHD